MSRSESKRIARESFLDALPVAEQAHVLRQAERVGPLPDDSDWLLAYATQQAAARIEAAVAAAESRLRVTPQGKPARVPSSGAARELFAFAGSVAAIASIATYVNLAHSCIQSIWLYSSAIALGVAGSAFYVWLRDRVTRIAG